jgi:hypothetical protein
VYVGREAANRAALGTAFAAGELRGLSIRGNSGH